MFAAFGTVLQVLGPPPRPVAALVPPVSAPVAPSASAAAPDAGWNSRIAAPEAALLEPSLSFPLAPLPRIAKDGRLPRVVYQRPTGPAGARPRIALILAGIGLSAADSRTAIETLPGAVTLAFSAYAPNPDALAELARERGHEMLASLPMEANGYPLNDAGPHSLLTGATPAHNQENLEYALGRLQGYVGVTGASDGMLGERFAGQTSSFGMVTDEIARRGLLYVDPRYGAPPMRLAGRSVDVVVEHPSSRADIEAKLAALERVARERGSAVGLAGPLTPVTIERIAAWSRDVEGRGFELVPISALVVEPKP